MGLISTALISAGSVLSDQWKEYFYCDSIPADVLGVKGKKRNRNNRGNDNIISNGSIIAIAEGQCMIIVEQGKVVDLCAEAGEYTYDMSTEPSLFYGNLSENIPEIFKLIGKRFTFAGDTAKDQRVYYFNTKEIIGNKYGTPSPIPFRVVDQRAGIDIDISIRCFGEYSYRITNPILFYTNVCGNVENSYTRDKIDSQLKSELLTALQPAFAKISDMGIRYSALPGHTSEIANALNDELSASWKNKRGIEIVAFGVNSVKASEDDEEMIQSMQQAAAYQNPGLGAAAVIQAQTQAMKDAANNAGGAAVGFMNMNMAAQAGGANAAELYSMAAAQNAAQQTAGTPAASADSWTCPNCGSVNTGKFCPECGMARPSSEWTCPSCGTVNKGKFCTECGTGKP